MEEDNFNIYVDRLKDGDEEEISCTLPPQFMDIHEAELQFKDDVIVEGHASIAQDALILQLSASTFASMCCAICNNETVVDIEIADAYFSEELASIKGGVFNYKELLRESLLLELPYIIECNNGSCPERKDMADLLSKRQGEGKEEELFYPFADL
jgi:hypothetical protein